MRSSSTAAYRRLWLALALVALPLVTGWIPTPQEGDVSEDPSDIVVPQLHVFISVTDGYLGIGEYYVVSNTGDRTYVGVELPETGGRATLSVALPRGAEGLGFDGPGLGERYMEQEGGYADTEPVPPGSATVETTFSYELPYREGMQVEQAFDVPVASVVLLLLEEGMALEGAGLTPGEPLDTQMGPAASYTAGPLAAGEPLVFALVAGGRPAVAGPPAAAPASRSPTLEAAVGLAAMAVALIAVYLLWRPLAPGPMPARARPLVDAIATLDAEFEAGGVGKTPYRRRRKALKRKLTALLEGTR